MEKLRDLQKMAESVRDKSSFIEFINALKEDRLEELKREKQSPSSPYGPGACGWENVSIEAFLDAMSEWADATSALTNQPMVPADPSWRSFAMILLAGKLYE